MSVVGMRHVLAVRGLTVRRGGRTILSGIDWQIARGELVALMGPSGSGKTTILRVLAGLDGFDGGSIDIAGVTIAGGRPLPKSDLAALRSRVGMVFQFHHLFDHLSVLRNVCLAPVHVRGVQPAAAEQRGLELLRALGVEHRARALPRELSGGEAQRVAIARALAVEPPLLLMDEPTASLDALRKAEVGALLRSLTSERCTLLMSTHDEAFAHDWATRVIRL